MNVLQSKVESLLFQRVARMVCTMEMDDVRYIDTLLNGLPNLHMNDKDGLSTRNNALLLHRFRKHVVRVYYDLLPIIISTIPKTLNTHALDNAGMRKINSSCSSRDFVVRNEIENTLQESDQTASASNADKVDALDSVVEVCSRINQLSNALLISFANQDIVSSVKFNYSNMISEPLTAASVVSTQAFADGNYLSDQGNSCALKNTAVLSRDRKEGVPLLGLSCERLHPLDYSADAYDINDMLSKYDKLGR